MTEDTTQPSVSVIIPAYGRVEPLKYTLRSAAASIAKSGYGGEIIVVDDGSEPSIEEQLAGFDARHPVWFVRQANQGSIVARMTGLREARGKYVQFLDSDDLLHPDKIGAQLRVMEKTGVDVTYTDRAQVTLGPDYSLGEVWRSRLSPDTDDSAELFTKVLPAPHGPIYRRDYLERALTDPIVRPLQVMDPAGDVWLLRNLALHPASVRRVAGVYAGRGPHEEGRFSLCWEKLGIAALVIDEQLMMCCPKTAATETLRRAVGEMAFQAWRKLPPDVLPEYDRRALELWRQAPASRPDQLGGRFFQLTAQLLGWAGAGKLFRRCQRMRYAQCKTLRDENEFAELLARLPE
jgi:hypothetical protein